MQLLLSPRLTYSCTFYLLAFVLIVVSKPAVVFDERARIRRFGTQPDQTLASLAVVTALLAVVSYYMFCVLDMVVR